MPIRRCLPFALLFVAALPAAASAQTGQDNSTAAEAGRIAERPAKDLGVVKTKTPPLLERALEDPYSMNGAGSCPAIANSVRALNGEPGPDFDDDTPVPAGSKKGALAKAGGTALVDSIIPFRGLVREVTGAASAERHVQLAKFAGGARRGFLRGIYQTRGCSGRL